jgi:hypothetical protein
MTSQHHQLQQRAHVSGTSKGKAKLKAGMPLMRNVIAKKGARLQLGAVALAVVVVRLLNVLLRLQSLV